MKIKHHLDVEKFLRLKMSIYHLSLNHHPSSSGSPIPGSTSVNFEPVLWAVVFRHDPGLAPSKLIFLPGPGPGSGEI